MHQDRGSRSECKGNGDFFFFFASKNRLGRPQIQPNKQPREEEKSGAMPEKRSRRRKSVMITGSQITISDSVEVVYTFLWTVTFIVPLGNRVVALVLHAIVIINLSWLELSSESLISLQMEVLFVVVCCFNWACGASDRLLYLDSRSRQNAEPSFCPVQYAAVFDPYLW